jgi:hypothetical protein
MKILIEKKLSKAEITILLVLGLFVFFNNLSSVEFQPDETYWIVSSTRFDDIISMKLTEKIWDEDFDTYEVRPIPGYIVAISQRIAGIEPDMLPQDYWDWSDTWENNIFNGAMPNSKIIFFSRLPMAILAAGSMLLITMFLSFYFSRISGYFFYILFINNYFLIHLRRAMTESILLFLSILVMISTLKIIDVIKDKNLKKTILWAIFSGILCGFASQSKLNGLGLALVVIIVSHITILKHRLFRDNLGKKLFISTTFLIPIFTVLIFILSYPFFYKNTIYRIIQSFIFRIRVTNNQLLDYPSDRILPDQRINILYNRIFVDIFQPSIKYIGFVIPMVILILTIYGIYQSIKIILLNKNDADTYVVILVAFMFLGMPMLFTPLDWDRYYLFPVLFSITFASIGFNHLVSTRHHINSQRGDDGAGGQDDRRDRAGMRGGNPNNSSRFQLSFSH